MGSKRDGQGATAGRGSRSDPRLCRVVGMGVRKEPKAGEAELQEQLRSYACLLGIGFLMHPPPRPQPAPRLIGVPGCATPVVWR